MSLSTIISAFLGFLPGLIWLAFFLQEDARHPEPKRLIFLTFILGGLVTFLVLPLQLITKNLFESLGFADNSAVAISALATIEELLKFFIVFVWISHRKDFDEPIDAMIYMITAALGFATVENVATAIRASNSFELLTLRFIGANLLHSLASGIIGFYWAMGLKSGQLKKYLAIGLVAASVIHAIFNILMLSWGPGIRMLIFLIFIAFFVLNDFELIKKRKVNLITPVPS